MSSIANKCPMVQWESQIVLMFLGHSRSYKTHSDEMLRDLITDFTIASSLIYLSLSTYLE